MFPMQKKSFLATGSMLLQPPNKISGAGRQRKASGKGMRKRKRERENRIDIRGRRDEDDREKKKGSRTNCSDSHWRELFNWELLVLHLADGSAYACRSERTRYNNWWALHAMRWGSCQSANYCSRPKPTRKNKIQFVAMPIVSYARTSTCVQTTSQSPKTKKQRNKILMATLRESLILSLFSRYE